MIRSGKDKGKSGKILTVDRKTGKIVIEGANIHHRFQKKRANQPGQKVSFPGMMHASKVMLIDPETSKPTRIGMKYAENGSKQRTAKKSGRTI